MKHLATLAAALVMVACSPSHVTDAEAAQFRTECLAKGGTFSAVTNRNSTTINNMRCYLK